MRPRLQAVALEFRAARAADGQDGGGRFLNAFKTAVVPPPQ